MTLIALIEAVEEIHECNPATTDSLFRVEINVKKIAFGNKGHTTD